jgi:hypothetical protein
METFTPFQILGIFLVLGSVTAIIAKGAEASRRYEVSAEGVPDNRYAF